MLGLFVVEFILRMCMCPNGSERSCRAKSEPCLLRPLKDKGCLTPTLRPGSVSLHKDQGAQILIMQTILVPSPLAVLLVYCAS